MERLSADTEPPIVASGEAFDVLDSAEAGGLIVRGGALRFGSYIAVVGLSVLSAGLLTRHLGVVGFGEYTTVISLVTIVASVTDAGMSNIGAHEYAVRRGAERDELMRNLLGLRVALTLVGILLALAFAVGAGYDTALLAGTVAAGLGTVAIVWQHTLSIPLATALRLGVMSSLELARQILSVALIVVLVSAGAGVLPLLAVVLVVNLLLIPPTAALVRGQISARPSIALRGWASLLGATISFSLATAVGTLYVYTAQILTSLVASRHQSGLFAVSFRVFIVAAGVAGMLVGVTLPVLSRAARDNRARLQYALQRIFEVTLIAGVAAALGFVVGAHFIVGVIAGRGYSGSVPVLQLQALALLPSFLLAGWSYALLSLKRYRGLLIANAIAFAVSCGLTLTLAATDGAQGAAIATVCGESALAVGYLIVLTRAHPELRPQAALLVKVLASAIPAVALALLTDLPSALAAILVLAVYGALILATGAMPRELAELIPHPRRAADR
ncbi:MAG: polysaccharide biosynthesis C-terminal domain-containing protein [Solirubrobacterales bacterium]